MGTPSRGNPYKITFMKRQGGGERAGTITVGCSNQSIGMPLRDEVRLHRAVFAPADDLPVLPAAAKSLPLVRLGAVKWQRGANVPELHRAVLAAAQHLHTTRDRTKKRRENVKCLHVKRLRSKAL